MSTSVVGEHISFYEYSWEEAVSWMDVSSDTELSLTDTETNEACWSVKKKPNKKKPKHPNAF